MQKKVKTTGWSTDKRLANLKRWDPKIPFTSQQQPTPAQKSAWRERRREAKRMLDEVMRLWMYTVDELKEYIKRKDLLVKDVVVAKRSINILTKDKFLLDRLERHIPKAPQSMELTGKDWWPIQSDSTHVVALLKKNGVK